MDDSEDELVVNRSNCKTYSRNSVEFIEDDSEIQIYEEVKVKDEPLDEGKKKLVNLRLYPGKVVSEAVILTENSFQLIIALN